MDFLKKHYLGFVLGIGHLFIVAYSQSFKSHILTSNVSVVLAFGAYWLLRNKPNLWLQFLLFMAPIVVSFSLVVFRIDELYRVYLPSALGFGLAALIHRLPQLWQKAAVGILALVMIVVTDMMIIPRVLFTNKLKPTAAKPIAVRVLDADSAMVADAQFKDQALFIMFWSTSCGACIRQFEEIHQLHRALKDHPRIALLVVNSSDKDDFADFTAFIGKADHDLPFYYDANLDLARQFGVYGHPYTVLLTREHTLAYEYYGYCRDAKSVYADEFGKALRQLAE